MSYSYGVYPIFTQVFKLVVALYTMPNYFALGWLSSLALDLSVLQFPIYCPRIGRGCL